MMHCNWSDLGCVKEVLSHHWTMPGTWFWFWSWAQEQCIIISWEHATIHNTQNIKILTHTIHILFYFSYACIFHTLIFKLNYFLFPPTNYFLHYEPNTDIIDFITTQVNSEVNTGSSREPRKVVLPDTTFKWLEMDIFRCSIKIIPGIIKNNVVYFI